MTDTDAEPEQPPPAAPAGIAYIAPPPEATPAEPGAEGDAASGISAELGPHWDEQAIRSHLEAVGLGLHELVGRAEADWQMTDGDLSRIAPPLTRMLNRHERTRALSGASDPMALTVGVGTYGLRSYLQTLRAVRAERAEREAEEEQGAGPRVGYAPASATADDDEIDPDTIRMGGA